MVEPIRVEIPAGASAEQRAEILGTLEQLCAAGQPVVVVENVAPLREDPAGARLPAHDLEPEPQPAEQQLEPEQRTRDRRTVEQLEQLERLSSTDRARLKRARDRLQRDRYLTQRGAQQSATQSATESATQRNKGPNSGRVAEGSPPGPKGPRGERAGSGNVGATDATQSATQRNGQRATEPELPSLAELIAQAHAAGVEVLEVEPGIAVIGGIWWATGEAAARSNARARQQRTLDVPPAQGDLERELEREQHHAHVREAVEQLAGDHVLEPEPEPEPEIDPEGEPF